MERKDETEEIKSGIGFYIDKYKKELVFYSYESSFSATTKVPGGCLASFSVIFLYRLFKYWNETLEFLYTTCQ